MSASLADLLPDASWDPSNDTILDHFLKYTAGKRLTRSQTPPARSLENWLRQKAREEIHKHLAVVTARLGERADRVYVMGQRTKWGTCSARRNLSFNWRLIPAPDFVLRCLVTHEAAQLAIPDLKGASIQASCQAAGARRERERQGADP